MATSENLRYDITSEDLKFDYTKYMINMYPKSRTELDEDDMERICHFYNILNYDNHCVHCPYDTPFDVGCARCSCWMVE